MGKKTIFIKWQQLDILERWYFTQRNCCHKNLLGVGKVATGQCVNELSKSWTVYIKTCFVLCITKGVSKPVLTENILGFPTAKATAILLTLGLKNKY